MIEFSAVSVTKARFLSNGLKVFLGVDPIAVSHNSHPAKASSSLLFNY